MEKQSQEFRAYTRELQKLAEEDQVFRANPEGYKESVDERNTARMKEIIDEIGWPTISRVGEEGSRNAWLLVQHADHDREFQKKCLGLMKTEVAGDVLRQNIAFLEDRIAVAEGRPQLYGTQFTGDREKNEPQPIDDPENLDKRRKETGLESFDDYKKRMQEG